MRQYIIAGNWKMNKTVSESVQLAKDIVEAVKDVKKTEVSRQGREEDRSRYRSDLPRCC